MTSLCSPVRMHLFVKPVRASVHRDWRACVTSKNTYFRKLYMYQGLIFKCPFIFCIHNSSEITETEINYCVFTMSHP